jgi:hypothetical protein
VDSPVDFIIRTRRKVGWFLFTIFTQKLHYRYHLDQSTIEVQVAGIKSKLHSSQESESELLYNWRSVSQYVLVSSPIWDFWPEILFFFCFSLKVTVLSNLGRPLWREVGSVICQSVVNIVCSGISMYIQFTLCVIHSSQLNTIQYNRIKRLQ